MKNVLLRHDSDILVYSVPNEVADNLEKYCLEFCVEWIWKDPNAEKYRHTSKTSPTYVLFGASDFIEYLNKWKFPKQQSILVDNIGDIEDEHIPEKYINCPRFWF